MRWGYYLYLPAHFIYHDLQHVAFSADIMHTYRPSEGFYQAFQVPGGPEGDMVMKYTGGLALLWLPFFGLGHLAAGWLHYPQDGFSAPYQIAIAFAGLAYGVLGLLLLRKVLLRYFPDTVAAATLGLVVLGTNYLQYTVYDGAMAHTYLFTGYALLLWLTLRWHEQPSRGRALGIGLTLGLLVLIRPSEAVAALIPLLWGLDSRAALRSKLTLLQARWPDVLLLVLGGVLGVLPQGLYWHWATGHWLFYSYGDQHFSFLHPHLKEVLTSARKGWLLYTPLAGLALLGLGALWRQQRGVAVAAIAFLMANLWVVAAWDIWWYGGSIGQRSLVQSYAVLALGGAAAVAWLLAPGRRPAWRWAACALAVLGVDLNLLQHWQYMNGIIVPDGMTKPYYFAIFNNPRPTQDDLGPARHPAAPAPGRPALPGQAAGQARF